MNHFDEITGLMEMCCDAPDCAYGVDFYGSYQECIDEAKNEGWGLKKMDEDGEWFHFCPEHNPWKRPDPTEMFKD